MSLSKHLPAGTLVTGFSVCVDGTEEEVRRFCAVTFIEIKRKPDDVVYYKIPMARCRVKIGTPDGGAPVNRLPAPADPEGVYAEVTFDKEWSLERTVSVAVGLVFEGAI
jgi:hypothetical protein